MGRTHVGQLHKWLTGAAQLDDRIDAATSAPEPVMPTSPMWWANRTPVRGRGRRGRT